MFQKSLVLAVSFASFMVVSLFGLAFVSSAQLLAVDPPAIVWEKAITKGSELPAAARLLPDGGLVITGSNFRTTESAEVFLIRTDVEGTVKWSRTYSFGVYERGNAVTLLDDGGFAITGGVRPAVGRDYEAFLFLTDAEGQLRGSSTVYPATAGKGGGHDVLAVSGGGYLIVSDTIRDGSGADVCLIGTDPNGTEQWRRYLGGDQDDYGYTLLPTNDGGYVVSGSTASYGLGGWDAYLAKVDASGNIAPNGWQKMYGGPAEDWGYDILTTGDGYFLVGTSNSFGSSTLDAYLVKLAPDGQVIWERTFPGPGEEHAYSVHPTPDGGVVIASVTCDPGCSQSDIIRVDAAGNLQWQKSFSWPDLILDVLPTSDNAFVAVGVHGDDWTHGLLLIKLAQDPVSGLQSPRDLLVGYSNFNHRATLTWIPSPDATGYLIERKLGCQPWQEFDTVDGNANLYEDESIPPGSSVGYRVIATRDDVRSQYSNEAYTVVPTTERWQHKLYDPDAPNQFSEEAGAWVDCYPCDHRFKEDRGTAVIVHGWNPPIFGGGQLNDWMLDTARLISQRFNGLVNVIAWDWEDEARGRETDGPVPTQVVRLANALKTVLPTGYDRPLHLMGHSLGALVVSAASLELLEPRQSSAGTFQPHQVTLWDSPDAGVTSNLTDQVRTLRSRDVYVELYYGVSAIGTHGANLWVNVPGVPLWPFCAVGITGHSVHQWYRCTIPTNSPHSDPVLYRYKNESDCFIEPIPTNGTIGFGTSVLLLGLTSRPDPADCPGGTLRFGLRRACPIDFDHWGDHFVLLGSENCENALAPTQETVSDLTNGDYWLREDWQPSFGFVNSTEMFLGAQAGGGGGAAGGLDEGEPDVRYTLTLDIQSEWDYLSFEYDFTEAVAPTTLSATITAGDVVYPVFQMSSDIVLAEGYLDTGLRDIRSLHGQTVTIAFELRSVQPGMVVYLRNPTFWRDPWNGNRAPMANAGPDQVVDPDASGLGVVTLDALATVDPDGDTLNYRWMLDSEVLAVGIQPAVCLLSGNHLIQLVVRDPADHVSTDEVLVVITGETLFRRGDSNLDGRVDLSDAVNTLGYLFSSTGNVTCQDAADANDSGDLDISDPIFTLGFLFLGAPTTIPDPYPDRGPDLSPDPIGCDFYPL